MSQPDAKEREALYAARVKDVRAEMQAARLPVRDRFRELLAAKAITKDLSWAKACPVPHPSSPTNPMPSRIGQT